MAFKRCECTDPGCPEHEGVSKCTKVAMITVHRVDMEDDTGTRMCHGCGEDALDSGVFTVK